MNEYPKSTYGNSSLTSYLEQKTLSSSPLELVAMLYLKAISEVRDARRHLTEHNIALRSKAISKTCDAIGEMDASLNMEAGGELAERLRALYRYCLVRLLDANLHQTDEPLAEVLGLLVTMSEAWQTIAQTSAQNTSNPAGSSDGSPVGRWEMTEASGHSHSWTL